MGSSHRLRVEAHLGPGAPGELRAAFTEAVRAGAALVEVDVQRTADGHLLVHHDYTLPDGRWVHETDLPACLDALSVEGSGEPPLSVEDAVTLAAEHGVGLTLDVKSGMGNEHAVDYERRRATLRI